MTEPTKLWAVHVQGSDDIYPMPSEAEAATLKGAFDALDAKNEGHEFAPQAKAVVIEWPHSAEAHAKALRELAEEGW